MSTPPRLLCWPRFTFGRAATVAALRAADGIELVVAESLPEVLQALPSIDAMVLHSAPAEIARPVVEAIEASGRVRWMHFLTAGRDGFEAAGLTRDVVVSHVPGASAPAVAEHAMALLLALGRGLPATLERMRAARWDRASAVPGLVSFEGTSVAVVGTGAIGREIAKRLRAFGAAAIGVSRRGEPDPAFDAMHPVSALHAVLARCSAAMLAVPLDDATRHLFDARAFAAMPRGAFLVNVARGGVVDQAALCDTLERGHLGGAGLDVTDPEPPAADERIWRCPNAIVTPHVAVEGNTPAVERIAAGTAENVRRFVAGEPLLGVASR